MQRDSIDCNRPRDAAERTVCETVKVVPNPSGGYDLKFFDRSRKRWEPLNDDHFKDRNQAQRSLKAKLSNPIYTFHVNMDERGIFDADVRDLTEQTIYEIHIDGDDEDSLNLIDAGYMKHTEDITGLEEYLKQQGVIPSAGEIRKAK